MTASSGKFRRLVRFAALLSIVSPVLASGGFEAAAAAPDANAVRIDVDRLAAPSIDTVGALTAVEGGLPADMWRNTPRALVDALLPRMPVATSSPAMRGLMRRLLLSAAAVPPGPAESGAFISQRAFLLWRMGELDDLLRLIAAVPAEARAPPLLRMQAEAQLLRGETDTACRTAQSRVTLAPEVFWQKLLGFCHARGGEPEKAALTVALLTERGEDVRDYAALLAALSGTGGDAGSRRSAGVRSGGGALPHPPNPSPLDLAMLRAAGGSPAPEAASAEDLPVLIAIADSESFTESLRQLAAERAVSAGVLPAERLYPLLGEETPAKALTRSSLRSRPETAAAASTPDAIPGLLQAALAEPILPARTQAALQVLEAGRREGRYLAATRLVTPFLTAAAPAPELAGYAQGLVPALLVLRERTLAAMWMSWLQQRMKTAAVADAAITVLMPLARLVRLEQAQAWTPDDLFKWWESERSRPASRTRTARLFALLSATGETVPEALDRALLDGPAQLPSAATDPAFATQLAHAAAARRVGETVMLSLVILGPQGPEAIGTQGAAQIVESLRAVGLEADARALAVELMASQ